MGGMVKDSLGREFDAEAAYSMARDIHGMFGKRAKEAMIGTYSNDDLWVLSTYGSFALDDGVDIGGLMVGAAKGDNYQGAIRTMLAAGCPLMTPSGRLVTGNEKKKTAAQPADVFTVDDDSIYVFQPQDFPERLRDGDADVGIGGGYDIFVEEARIRDLNLNGDMANRGTRVDAMQEELSRTGCTPVLHLGYSPVVAVLMARRDGEVRIFDDLKTIKNPVGMSEYVHILHEWGKHIGIPFSKIKYTKGATEAQLMAGWAHAGSEIVQTGGSLLDDVERLMVVRDNDGKYVVINYSDTWVVASEKAMGVPEKRQKILRLEESLSTGVERVRKNEPGLFEEQYISGLDKYRAKEDELGLVA